MTRLVKWMRLLGFARGSLSRRSDRAQRMLLFGAVAAALLAIPVAADAAGSVAPESVAATHQTIAVLTEDAHVQMSYSEYGPVDGTKVKAKWPTPNGGSRSGDINVTANLKAGERVPIWTDQTGNPLDGPETSVGHVMHVLFVGAVTVLGWLVGVVVCYLLVAWLLLRRRVAAWDRAWARADQDWRRTV
ncbi:hypothetical protein LWC34_17610 [Kibdelosporangium philippinense]|uniref:Uncharacterized protein n=1 Tax=Kibdelosporangium philippinense TaxID=211113 RepID=A0ABS8ZB34_9PSEU|nr:hypothetical protein [Kibdelosporangium philippinense]MCE7004627.1 hypothetical protein [Kibdelosporangium philippinense]